ncbi:MAG TPA: glycine oxidase ThiO [Planctomycetaceae bacterium]|nr:glycine oxidase ThiO [Planctomycetaceae bacterium]HRF02688.1 glycine oxidase ThiO [Pirellulaceae bacterium]
MDLIVIGGGVVGLSIAWEGARRGLKVRVLESGELGRAASWAGAGLLPPPPGPGAIHPLDALGRRAAELHPSWARELTAATGIDTGFRRCGGLYLADLPGEAASLAAIERTWLDEGWRIEPLSPDAVRRRHPEIAAAAGGADIRRALFAPEESQLRNPRHLKALAEACRRAGVELHERAPVERLEADDVQATAIVDGERQRAARICVAAGAWSKRLAEPLGLKVEVMPIRGQMLLYRFPEPPLRTIVNVGPRYLVPRDDGHLLVGSTEEEAGFDASTTAEGLAGLERFARRWLARLDDRPPIASWAGLRPGSVDGQPYVGPAPGLDRIWLATGHFRSGLTLSPATAELVIDLMTGTAPQVDPGPFLPRRGWTPIGPATSLDGRSAIA